MKKDTILFVNAIRPLTFDALKTFEKQTGRHFTPIVLVDATIKDSITAQNGQHELPGTVEVIAADFNSSESVRRAIQPFQDRLFAVTAQFENSVLELQKLVPYLPYMPMPTESSLEWGTEKKLMRSVLASYDQSLVPAFLEAIDESDDTIRKIEETIEYPMIVKPSGLEGSLLVSLVHNNTELRKTIHQTFQAMQSAYDTWIKRQVPAIMVEEFMVGDMYSIDTYVNHDGLCYHTPPIKVIKGRDVGFDDFFDYMTTPATNLTPSEIEAAETAARNACHALGLRSVTAHIELMHTAHGWKIIELGPRIGGVRHEINSQAYGINHIVNDILNRAGEVPHIPREIINHTATFNIYAPKEGTLKQIDGIEEIRSLPSYVYLRQDIKIGEPVLFTKNNGDPVINLMLSHPDKNQFDADVAAMEKHLTLHVTPA